MTGGCSIVPERCGCSDMSVGDGEMTLPSGACLLTVTFAQGPEEIINYSIAMGRQKHECEISTLTGEASRDVCPSHSNKVFRIRNHNRLWCHLSGQSATAMGMDLLGRLEVGARTDL